MQGGQLVAGFNKWKDTFHRTVKKGEKGIKILAPAPYKVKQKMEKLDEQGKPILDKDGKPLTEEKTVQIPAFKVVSVFDVSQTEGAPLPVSYTHLDSVTAATDAGREGELIFRFVYQMAGCTKPVKRLWVSSMEDDDKYAATFM